MNRTAVLIIFSVLHLQSSAQAQCPPETFHDQYDSKANFLSILANARQTTQFDSFKGLGKFFELLKKARASGEALDVILQLPTESGVRVVVVPLEKVSVPGVSLDAPFNPYLFNKVFLKLSLNQDQSIQIPLYYLYRAGIKNADQTILGAFIPRATSASIPEMAQLAKQDRFNQIQLEFAATGEDFKKIQKSLSWQGPTGSIGTLFELFNIERDLYPEFNEAVTKLIPSNEWGDLYDSAGMTNSLRQLNAGLTFIRKFNFRLGGAEKIRSQLEAIQLELLARHIQDYHKLVNGERLLQASFNVPDGGLFYLTSDTLNNSTHAVKLNGYDKIYVKTGQSTPGDRYEVTNERESKAESIYLDISIGKPIEIKVYGEMIYLWPMRVSESREFNAKGGESNNDDQ